MKALVAGLADEALLGRVWGGGGRVFLLLFEARRPSLLDRLLVSRLVFSSWLFTCSVLAFK